MTTKLYPDIYPGDLEPYYSRHAAAMTAEGLHDKGAIAEQLAWRDRELLAAVRRRDELDELLDDKLDNLRLAQEDADRNWKRAIAAEADLLATRRALRLAQELLRECEWIAYERNDYHCSDCDAEQSAGHKPGCRVDQVLSMAADCGEEVG